MTALYINGRFLQQPLSGVQRFALEMTTALAQVWPGDAPPLTLLVPPGTDTHKAPICAIEVGTRRGAAWEQLDLPRHAADGFLLNLGNTGPFFLKRQAVIIHDTGAFSTPEAYSRTFVTYYRLLHRWLSRTNTRIVTISHASRDDIRHHLGTPRHGVSLISEGSDHMDRVTADPVFLTRHGLEPRRYALAVGNLAVHKNLAALSELAQRLDRRGISLVITGQLDSTVFQTRGTQLPEPARYVGRVSDGELKALYQSAACFVFPSRYEGFGLPAVEAMACGCPVVASAIPALQEICGNAALFVDPRAPADIARSVERILDDPALADRLRREGVQRAAMFTWEKGAHLLVTALLPLVGSNACQNKELEVIREMGASQTIAVGIATVGRAAILRETLRELQRQTRPPQMIFVCGTKPADIEGVEQEFPDVHVLFPAEPGLTRQRNTIIEAAHNADILVFFDDDFLADRGYLDAIDRAMAASPAVVVATGIVLADGIIGPGLTPHDAREILATSPQLGVRAAAAISTKPVFTGYGCNMAIRLAAVRRHSVAFDPRLPLYGWQEDVDLSRRLAAFGDVVQVSTAVGVHLGVKSGRASGVRLGYSQVANPLYLSGKRSGYPYRRAMTHIARNMARNIAKSIRPEPYVDRRGRLRGNIIALYDLVRGRMVPERILDL